MSSFNLVDTVYTPAEVMAILKLSRNQVYEMLRTGEIPALRVGRIIRVSRQDLEAFLTRSAQAAK